MVENLEAIRQHGIRKFIKSKKRARDLFKMRRGNLCSPGYLLDRWREKRIIGLFILS